MPTTTVAANAPVLSCSNPSGRIPLSAQGFTIHVHATDVPVWRLSGNNSSKKVAQVGTVDVGDLVYRVP